MWIEIRVYTGGQILKGRIRFCIYTIFLFQFILITLLHSTVFYHLFRCTLCCMCIILFIDFLLAVAFIVIVN